MTTLHIQYLPLSDAATTGLLIAARALDHGCGRQHFLLHIGPLHARIVDLMR